MMMMMLRYCWFPNIVRPEPSSVAAVAVVLDIVVVVVVVVRCCCGVVVGGGGRVTVDQRWWLGECALDTAAVP